MEEPPSPFAQAVVSDEYLSSDDSYSSVRQNKYSGPQSTWRSYTEDERALTSSILRLRDQDLALHLYNTHALKQNHYSSENFDATKPWASKKRWLDGVRDKDDISQSWLPSNSWAAWPLNPDEVPRKGEQVGPGDDLEDYTLRRNELPRPSRELEEILNGTILSVAKERFRAREWTPVSTSSVAPSHEDQKIVEDAKDWASRFHIPTDAEYKVYQKVIRSGKVTTEYKMLKREGDQKFSSKGAKEAALPEALAVEDQATYADKKPNDGTGREAGNMNSLQLSSDLMELDNDPATENVLDLLENSGSLSGQKYSIQPVRDDLLSGQEAPTVLDQSGSTARSEGLLDLAPALRPVISADDDRSRTLLRPTIRATLSKFDQLLIALHHTRQTCVRYGSEMEHRASQDETDDAATDDNEAEASKSNAVPTPRRGRGRPRKTLSDMEFSSFNIADQPSPKPVNAEPDPKKARRGRPNKVYEQLEGETYQEMLIRVARLKKKSISSVIGSVAQYNPSPIDPTSKGSSQHRSKPRSRPQRQTHLNIRDWSEVMGTAGLVGFPSEVVSRATQRCATLFGEGMVMHSLAMNGNPGIDSDGTTCFVPDLISYLPAGLDQGTKQGERQAHEDASSEAPEEQPRRTIRSRPSSRRCDNHRSQSIATVARSRSRAHSADSIVLSDDDDDDDDDDAASQPADTAATEFSCPDPTCPRHTDGFRQRAHVRSHLQRAHKLAGEALEQAFQSSNAGGRDDAEVLQDGVHVDGFLTPVRARGGWRGRDLESRERKLKGEDLSRSRSRSKKGKGRRENGRGRARGVKAESSGVDESWRFSE